MAGTLIWITGLSGVGKTTLARELQQHLDTHNFSTVVIDGDQFREIMGGTTGYHPEDRLDNARRIARLCHYLCQEGVHVIAATMSLFHEIHSLNRHSVDDYLEVFLTCPIEELCVRDQKGLYSGIQKGSTQDVVGMDLAFEAPINPDLVLTNQTPSDRAYNIKEITQNILEGVRHAHQS